MYENNRKHKTDKPQIRASFFLPGTWLEFLHLTIGFVKHRVLNCFIAGNIIFVILLI